MKVIVAIFVSLFIGLIVGIGGTYVVLREEIVRNATVPVPTTIPTDVPPLQVLPEEPMVPLETGTPQEISPVLPSEEMVACTMDAKLCPDGSAVGRSGPNCEFAPCPGE